MEMKISQPIFGILVALTKNELTKIFNKPGKNNQFPSYFSIQKLTTVEPVKIVERRREISEIIIIDNNVEMDDNDDDDYENNERLN